jgi:hypothetical protein
LPAPILNHTPEGCRPQTKGSGSGDRTERCGRQPDAPGGSRRRRNNGGLAARHGSRTGRAGLAGPQSGDIRIDVQAKTGGDPTGLSHHEDRFRQGLSIPLLQSPQLLDPHMEPSRHLFARHASGQAGLFKGLA